MASIEWIKPNNVSAHNDGEVFVHFGILSLYGNDFLVAYGRDGGVSITLIPKPPKRESTAKQNAVIIRNYLESKLNILALDIKEVKMFVDVYNDKVEQMNCIQQLLKDMTEEEKLL